MQQTDQTTTYSANAPANYQQYFVPNIGAPVAGDLVASVGLRPGQRVLDVACGTGVVTRLAAKGVAPGGGVTGLDLNPGMLAVARSVAPADPAIDWVQGDAQSMPLKDGAFDVVLCQMGLQFMSDKAAALREMHRVLAPGGRILVSLPGPRPALFAVLAEAFARHLGQDAARFVDLVFSLHEPDPLRDLFEGSGFREIRIDARPKTLVVPPPRDFLWEYIYSTPLAESASRAAEPVRAALEREVSQKWRSFVDGGKLRFDVSMTMVSAVR